MKKQLVIVGILSFLVSIGLSGCTNNILKPNIQFEKVEEEGLRVISVNGDVNWSNINITISSGYSSDIYLYPAPQMSYRYSYGNGSSCPDNWGIVKPENVIYFFLIKNNITVQLKWIPTNEKIGEWNFP